MLKKILLTSIAFSLILNAESISTENTDCEEPFEKCMSKCEESNSNEKDIMCFEKCEMLYDKCLLTRETNAEINLRILTDEEKELEKNDENYIQSEIEENSKLDDSIQKIELELSKD